MFGKTGRGKTHLSLAIANRVLQNGYNVLYDSAINFLRQVEKEHFGRGGSNDDTLDTLLSCDLLILDDLGTEFHKQFYQSTVYNIINTRMNRDLPTIISTNLNHNEISALYDERITSRIYTTYTCLHFVGQDVRVREKSKNAERVSVEEKASLFKEGNQRSWWRGSFVALLLGVKGLRNNPSVKLAACQLSTRHALRVP